MARLTSTRKLTIAFCAAATLLSANGAHAQQGPKCGPRQAIADVLTNRYAEVPVSMGLSQDGAMLELFATASGTTWTMLATNPEGISCVVSHGETWMSLTPVSGRIS